MLTSYQRTAIVEGVIEREVGSSKDGGLVDHPADPGGLTKWGISQRAYPDLDIRNLTKADAVFIYQRDYLVRFKLHELSNIQNAEIVMDWLVNGGSVKLVQRAVGVTQDNVMGPETLAAIDAVNPRVLLMARLDYYVSIVKHPFLAGWVNRLKHLGL